jgi:7-cyano-7-deazaguanine synthase in queuosine biosynthesis
MDNDRFLVCGDAAPKLSNECEEKTTRLHLYGEDDDNKVTLKINELQEQMYKEAPPRFRDLLDIATYVYAADQTSRRGANDVDTFGSYWRRHFRFFVPVRDIEFWNSPEVRECLIDTLNFLSDDRYEFTFSRIERQDPFQSLLNFNEQGAAYGFPEQVVMYSGGLDSLGGAVEEVVNQKRRVMLVNHRSTQKLDRRYAKLRDQIDAKSPNNQPSHIRVTVHKKKWMNQEATQRSRYFNNVALGATIANMLGQSNVRFYENGIISLNLPVCAQVVGGKATRTTHPRVIDGFEKLLSQVSSQTFVVDNPFRWKTKSEVAELILRAGCAELIADSISCTHTWEITNKHSHCGYCSQCVDRRFAIAAAGLEQHDPLSQYRMDVFTESRSERDHVNGDKVLFASYLERSNQVDRIDSPLGFLRCFPEVARALQYLDGDAGASVQRCYEMYKRHSDEVNRVIDKMLALHRQAIRQRTLPPDAMLRIVYESNLPSTATATPVKDELPASIFRRRGGAWQARFQGGQEFIVLPQKGADYIHRLLSTPGEALDAVDIVCSAAADYCHYLMNAQAAIDDGLRSRHNPLLDTLGEIADWEAIGQYRDEANRLRGEIDRARADQNEGLVRELESEIAEIVATINSALGIGGKLRRAKDKRKNIRDGFRSNVKRAIEKIEQSDPNFAKHLKEYLTFGDCPKYHPPEAVAWELRPVVNE